MKLFDIEWLGFFQRLEVWNRLALGTRQALAQLKSNETVPPEDFGDDLPRLADARFVKVYVDGQRAKLHKDGLSFARVIRAMCRHDILEQPNATMMCNYVRDHFTVAEQIALSPDTRNYYHDVRHLACDVMSAQWPNDFLSLESLEQAREWESLRQQNRYSYQQVSGEPLLGDIKTLTATQSIIRPLLSSTEPVSFEDMPIRFKHMSLPLLAAATYAGIRYLLLFPSMRKGDMTPMLNVWPAIPQRLHRPKAKPPKAVIPDQTFHCAYLMEDMTTVLIGVSGEPPRIRSSDHALFTKAQQQLESNMTSIPKWLTQVGGVLPGPRVLAAIALLQAFEFIETRGTHGKDLRFEPTAEAQDWLGLSSKDRLGRILDRLKGERSRKLKLSSLSGEDDIDMEDADNAVESAHDVLRLVELENDEDDDYDCDPPFMSYGHDHRLDFLPRAMNWTGDADRELNIQTAMIEAYGSLARRRFVRFSQFVEYHTQQANPLSSPHAGAEPPKIRIKWSRRKPTDEEAEDLWGQWLADFLRLRLLPLGGVKAGIVAATGELCIALTDIGRFFLDLNKGFDYGQQHEQQGHIVVQPNFDVVFLSPAPLAEATIARFAERKGNGMGTLFRLTKKSAFAAASNGMTAEQVLGTLRDTSTKAIPTNVMREIEGWFDQCGRVSIKATLLIRCPNAQIANRVLAAGGKKLTPISDTMLELADRKFKAPLVKKLKETGIFLDQSSLPATRKPPQGRRHRRRRW